MKFPTNVVNLRCLEKAKDAAVGSASRLLLPSSAYESYNNPRLENPEDYLNQEHIQQLKDGSEIVDWEIQEDEIIPGIGTIRRIGIVTKNGYGYAGLIGIPENQQSSLPIIGTSAWFTSTEGHNERVMRNFMRAGNYTVFLGSEGSYRPEYNLDPNTPITLSDSAAAVLNFAYHSCRELDDDDHNIDIIDRLLVGESRGGMVGMGIIALAEEFNQNIIMADLTAPCLPRKMKLADIRNLSSQILSEPKEIIRLGGNLALSRLVHYPETLDLSPTSLKYQLLIGPALFSGEAGELARHIDKEQLLHITVFENDFASMPDVWREIFADFPNVRITPLPGSHLTLADLETLQFIIARNKTANNCINIGSKLTKKAVFDEAHKIAPAQHPIHHSALAA